MVVIKMLRLRIATNPTGVPLFTPQLVDRLLSQSISAEPICIFAQPVVARLAAPPEAGRRGRVADVVVVRNGTLAGGTPSEAFGDPGQISDLFAE
jgi:hypothetical protein